MKYHVTLLVFTAALSVSVQAATVPFTFEVTYDLLLGGIPGPENLTITSMNIGSGVYSPFGDAAYTESGTATFGVLPSGDLVLGTVSLNFTASFNGGADTFSGTDVHLHDALGNLLSETVTILSGTGMFSGATGSATVMTVEAPPSGNPAPNYGGTLTTSGSGEITAPQLTAVPEPDTMTLLPVGLAGVTALGAIRRRRRAS